MRTKAPHRFRWKEPRAFRRAMVAAEQIRTGRTGTWVRPVVVLVLSGVALGAMAWRDQPLAGSWPISVAVVLATAALGVYGVSLLANLDATIYFVGERGIGRQINLGTGLRHELWPWNEITHCAMATREVEGTMFRVIEIHCQHAGEEQTLIAALPETARLDKLEQAIRGHGCEVATK